MISETKPESNSGGQVKITTANTSSSPNPTNVTVATAPSNSTTTDPTPTTATAATATATATAPTSPANKKRKRGSKPKPKSKSKSKRNRKRPRGGVEVYNYGTDGSIQNVEESTVESEILPLVDCFERLESTMAMAMPAMDGNGGGGGVSEVGGETRRIRVVKPYPFTFATFAKARWLGRSILDVYHEEFGSYPRCYYESAIKAGRILVSGIQVPPSYKIKGVDELSHTVHRHEPAVALSNTTIPHNIHSTNDKQSQQQLIDVLHEDDDVLVVDKPPTLPVHPCGGYNFNSLFHILVEQDPTLEGRLFTVHRLDRLTSGLTIVAKSTDVAKALGTCITQREKCHKVYIARVKGCFPTGAPREKRLEDVVGMAEDCVSGSIFCEDGTVVEGRATSSNKEALGATTEATVATTAAIDTTNATSFWITNGRGEIQKDASLSDVFQSRLDVTTLQDDGSASTATRNDVLWLHLSCPCKIICHKNGICQAGSGGKPAQTAFAVVGYDELTDSTVVVCKPITGRTHQIRLHLQYLGHPIGNDPNYGGELFFADPAGLRACQAAQKRIDDADLTGGTNDTGTNNDDDGQARIDRRPENAISTDIPASEEEIARAGMHHMREESETLLSFIKRSCVWCARSRGENRSMLEFLVRSRGIWLHAFQYSMVGPSGKVMTYKTTLPIWGDLSMGKKI